MEVDVEHAIIEKKKKKVNVPIYHPHDWCQLVRACSRKFTVVEIEPDDFLDFSVLLKGPLVLRHKDVAGNPFKWHGVQMVRVHCARMWISRIQDLVEQRRNISEVEFEEARHT
ncbi:hypothetical protein PR048_012567 [Dryococelus australis]|uniref:Uncharacterized protein n=1 Tax=Dryococelus australis TaxID=614101 RepID=A0ABQ9HQJ7_9NEOP|nr:hypothetical protein PR048_012567 [Dryococelus australis]